MSSIHDGAMAVNLELLVNSEELAAFFGESSLQASESPLAI
jgi:hypothetical protein